MGKPAAIVRLLKGAKSLTGAQPSEEEDVAKPASEGADVASAEVISATKDAEPKALAEESETDDAVDLEAGIAAIFATKDAEVAPADNAGPRTSAQKAGADDALDFEADIASIFAMIRSGTGPDVAPDDLPEETGATYVLLSKLDRLWQNA